MTAPPGSDFKAQAAVEKAQHELERLGGS